MACFSVAMLKVHNLNEVAMSVLKRGLWSNYLLLSLDKSFLKDYANLFARAQKYMQAKEAVVVRQQAEGIRR